MITKSAKQLLVEQFMSFCFTLKACLRVMCVGPTQTRLPKAKCTDYNPDLCVCISGTWQTEGTSLALQSVRTRTVWIPRKRPNRKITATP